MKPLPSLLASATLLIAAVGTTAAHAGEIRLLDQGFGNVGTLAGWTKVNASSPRGESWFQGNEGIFGAQSGAANSYAAASFLGAANGSGSVDNWLITPTLALNGASTLSFFTRNDPAPGFSDLLEVRFAPGSGSDPAAFTTLVDSIGGAGGYPAGWTAYTEHLDFTGTGRFAFRYVGNAESLNYVGLDTVSVTTVPEPGSWAMVALGLGLAGVVRRTTRRGTHR